MHPTHVQLWLQIKQEYRRCDKKLARNRAFPRRGSLFLLRVTPQVSSTHCDSRKLLITPIVVLCLQHLTGWPRYEQRTDNGQTYDGRTDNGNQLITGPLGRAATTVDLCVLLTFAEISFRSFVVFWLSDLDSVLYFSPRFNNVSTDPSPIHPYSFVQPFCVILIRTLLQRNEKSTPPIQYLTGTRYKKLSCRRGAARLRLSLKAWNVA